MLKITAIFLVFCLHSAIVYGQEDDTVDSLKNELRFAKTDSAKFSILNTLARNASDPREKLTLAEEAVALARVIDYPRGIGQSYMKMAQAHRKLGDLPEAISAILNALKIYDEADYKKGIAVAYNTLGTIYASQEDYQKSIDNLNHALVISLKILDSTNAVDLKKLAGNYNNLGEVYRLSGRFDTANFNFTKAHKLYKDLGIASGEAYALGNLGLVHASQGNSVLAEQNMQQASDILGSKGDLYPLTVYHTSMADIYQGRGELKKALNYAHRSYDVSRTEGLKAQSRDASRKLSELYVEVQDYKKAHLYQSNYIAYRDSINNEESIRKMADLRTEYEVSKKQIEVDLLNQEALAQNFVLISLLIISALLIALLYVLYKGYTMKMKSHQVLAAQKSAIKTQRDELTILNQTKDRFFSIVSHDLRGPVSSFQGAAELIKMLVDSNELEDLIKLSNELHKSAGQLSSLLDNLLYWALNQQGKFPYNPEQIHVEEVVKLTISFLENTATSKRISILPNIESDLSVWSDKNSFLTILRNLMGNALKFTPAGGEIKVIAWTENDFATISVEDNGVGIPEEKLKLLFGFEGKRSQWGTEGEKGVGLGLTLTHEFVEMNKGSIAVESVLGEGTKFIFKLPLRKG